MMLPIQYDMILEYFGVVAPNDRVLVVNVYRSHWPELLLLQDGRLCTPGSPEGIAVLESGNFEIISSETAPIEQTVHVMIGRSSIAFSGQRGSAGMQIAEEAATLLGQRHAA